MQELALSLFESGGDGYYNANGTGKWLDNSCKAPGVCGTARVLTELS